MTKQDERDKQYRQALDEVQKRAQHLIDTGECADTDAAMRKIRAEDPDLYAQYEGVPTGSADPAPRGADVDSFKNAQNHVAESVDQLLESGEAKDIGEAMQLIQKRDPKLYQAYNGLTDQGPDANRTHYAIK